MMKDYRKYLRPETAAQIQNFELMAKLVVEGFLTGLHRSPYHGFSVEFAEYRPYREGDETKNIDWKVFGRTEKYYVKQFEEETNLRAMIALDMSGSMGYSSKDHISKFEYAAYLSAALSMLLIKQRDAVGLTLYDTEIKKFMAPNSKPSFISEILKNLADTKPADKTETAQSLDKLAEMIKRRGLVIILSDFFDDINKVLKALKHFRHKNNEVIVFQILDPREIDFKFGFGANFKDIESGEELITQPYQIQKAYKNAVIDFTGKIKQECINHNIDYNLISTDQSFDKALRAYLAKRSKM